MAESVKIDTGRRFSIALRTLCTRRLILNQRLIPLVLQLASLAGFLYQLITYLMEFYNYPTVSSTDVSFPSLTIMPAITFCNANRRKRSMACDRPQCRCVSHSKDFMCKEYPHLCPFNGTDLYLKFTPPELINIAKHECLVKHTAWRKIREESLHQELIESCEKIYENGTVEPCKHFFEAPCTSRPDQEYLGMTNGWCMALNSFFRNPVHQLELVNTSTKYQIRLSLHPEEYFDVREKAAAYIVAHDPRAFYNPYYYGEVLEGGSLYEITFSLTERKSLPYPYQSICFDYEEHYYMETYGIGALTREMCFEGCVYSRSKNHKISCTRISNAYYHYYYTPCPKKAYRGEEIEILAYCTDKCREPCRALLYELHVRKLRKSKCTDGNSDYCEFAFIDLEINLRDFRLETVTTYPKIQAVEIFSMIGSCLGLWFGLSLLSILDLFANMAYNRIHSRGRR